MQFTIYIGMLGFTIRGIHNVRCCGFFEKFDAVAELLKMKGERPLVTLTDYVANATIKELDKDKFTVKESLELVLDYLNEMKRLATEIRNEADEDGDFEVVMEFEDM